MPKNNKKTQQPEDGREGRPPDITFGCFIKQAKTRGSRNVMESIVDKTVPSEMTKSASSTLADDQQSRSVEKYLEKEMEFNSDQVGEKSSACAMGENLVDENFKVMRTKKGGFPVYLEKRAKGKKVTVIRQVSGNSKILLQLLKTKFGTGGLLKTGEVEIQGDFEEKVVKFLKENTQFMIQYNGGALNS